jgi:hypothetical protein
MKGTIKSIVVVRVIALLILTSPLIVKAQEVKKKGENPDPFTLNKEKMFKPYFAIETWATYTMGEEKNSTTYSDRADVLLRRMRFGGSGNPYPWLKYSFQMHVDRLGEDAYAATKGSYGGY